MYNKIYDFCKVRNFGGIYKNTSDKPQPRVLFLLDLLDSEGIEYTLDKFDFNSGVGYNIILKGDSTKMVVAHHDIVNPNIDNANDNSASVINAIMIKKLRPNMNVVLLDGEESGGIGSQRVSEQINDGYFGQIDWVLNLELTGRGGENFFIGNYSGGLFSHIKSIFDCPVFDTPFNDSVIFRRNGIDSCVINPLPLLPDGFLDYSFLFNCHTSKDSLSTIDTQDMKFFVEKILYRILQ
jgi:hypothetical protein